MVTVVEKITTVLEYGGLEGRSNDFDRLPDSRDVGIEHTLQMVIEGVVIEGVVIEGKVVSRKPMWVGSKIKRSALAHGRVEIHGRWSKKTALSMGTTPL